MLVIIAVSKKSVEILFYPWDWHNLALHKSRV